MKPRDLLGLLIGLCLFLCACATKPPPSQPEDLADYNERNDPYEPLNRKFYAVNETLDRNALHPAAVAYRNATTPTLRVHVHNVLSNFGNPAQLANDVLQAKPGKATDTFMRLLINSTVGIVGIFDAASNMGFPDHDNDFGLTLALWGIPGGPFLFLPVLGPTNPRDAIGYGVNSALDPLTWLSFGGDTALGLSRTGIGAVATRERVLDATDSIQKTALDPYATFRSLARQHRDSEVEAAKKDQPAYQPGSKAGPQQAPADVPRLAPSPSLTP